MNTEPAKPQRRSGARRVAMPLAVVAALLLSLFGLTTAANAQADDDNGQGDRNNGANVENTQNDNDGRRGRNNGANVETAQADDDNGRRGRNNGANVVNARNDNDGRGNGRNGGGFRFDCEVSHFNLDDPIVFPNEVGAAHDHMFWGNTTTDAFSTTDSLLANADSTCDGRRDGNQAAYWTPVLFDENGNAVEPTDIDVRYRGRRNVNPIPNGLEMLTKPEVLGADANDFEIEEDGDGMEFEISYPNCLAVDAGGNPVLSSDDNISHTAFSDGRDCPASHPHRIPRLQINLEFDLDIDTDWRLASDHDGMAQGMSLHADYMAAWTDDPPGS